MSKFLKKRRVEFADTDAAGIAHFASFFRYMEEAEHDMLRSVGLGVLRYEVNGVTVSWPRVSVTCDYKSMAKFEDLLEVSIWVAKIGRTSATYECDFYIGDRHVAVGRTTAVCCVDGEMGKPAPIEIPTSYLTGLKQLTI